MEYAVAKKSQAGITSYSQMLTQESALKSFAESLDVAHSALSRSLRARSGTSNHEQTLNAMIKVIATMPENSYILLDQDAATGPKIDFFKAMPLAKDVPVAGGTYVNTKARLALGNSILMIEISGSLFVILGNKKKAELSATGGVGLSVGQLSRFVKQDVEARSENEQGGPLVTKPRAELRFGLWANLLAKMEVTDGAVFTISPQKREEFGSSPL